jgi:hypothetical protein
MSWSKGSDVQRELARKHARQLMTAFDEVMKRETPEPVAVGAAVADLLSGLAKAAPAASADLDQRSHAQDRAAAR